MSLTQPRAVSIPQDSAIARFFDSMNLSDAYAIDLPAGTARNPEVLARFVILHQPRWVRALMRIRDALVAGVGLKTARLLVSSGVDASRIGIFKVYDSNALEVVMGEDDKHLDFRVSVLCRPREHASADGGGPCLVLSTVVHCHNRLGRMYIAFVAPFHRLVVQAFLRRAAKTGWPIEAESQWVGDVCFPDHGSRHSLFRDP
ncbi:MAG: DUF2867 domain-containing protein [Dokdonella sp.]